MEPEERLIFALDVSTLEEVEYWLDLLKGWIRIFKVGKQLFVGEGPQAVELIKEKGGEVFLDLKFHDIPSTVACAVREAAGLGVRMLTLHTLGGLEMMEAARKAIVDKARGPLLLGVTVLTSLGKEDLKEVGIDRDPEEEVLLLARLAKRAGLDGVVASPLEVEAVRKEVGEDLFIVTPGIRLPSDTSGDQVRVSTPIQAIGKGSDYIVVGRSIREASDPIRAVKEILECMEGP